MSASTVGRQWRISPCISLQTANLGSQSAVRACLRKFKNSAGISRFLMAKKSQRLQDLLVFGKTVADPWHRVNYSNQSILLLIEFCQVCCLIPLVHSCSIAGRRTETNLRVSKERRKSSKFGPCFRMVNERGKLPWFTFHSLQPANEFVFSCLSRDVVRCFCARVSGNLSWLSGYPINN